MELLLGRYDLMTVCRDDVREFDDELNRHSDKFEAVVNEDDILGALGLLRKGVCSDQCFFAKDILDKLMDKYEAQIDTSLPAKGDQCLLAKDILDKLMDKSEHLVDSGKIASLSRIHDFCFDFLHDLIQQGPGTTHMQLWIQMLGNKDFAFRDYYQKLNGMKLKNHIRFLKREYRSEEPEPDRSRFRKTLDPGIRTLLADDALRTQVFIEARPEFIELHLCSELMK